MKSFLKIVEFAMLLSVALLPLLLCGCEATSAAANHQTEHRALASAVLATYESDATPAPTPSPAPSPGKCANCDGTGKLGDGTVFVPCPVCGGDGRTDNEPPPKPIPDELQPPPPVAKPVSLVNANDCPGGVCVMPGACGSSACSAGGCTSCGTSRTSTRSDSYTPQRRGLFGLRRR